MVDDNTVVEPLDLLLIHPGSAAAVYGDLADELVAVEPPLWCRLLAGYLQDKQFSVRVIDAEANCLSPTVIGLDAFAMRPRVVCIVAYGHQPSASTQQMEAVYAIAKAVRSVCTAKILVVGGHVSALPAQTLKECSAIDYVCVGEGPVTLCQLLGGVRADKVEGLAWRSSTRVILNTGPALIEDLSLLHGRVWNKLPMHKYRSHNWQCLDDLSRRSPYASVYTSLGCPYSCSFCCINAPFGARRYRMRRPIDVFQEIVELYNYHGVRTFKIVDEMFVLNPKHYGELCGYLGEWNAADDINIWAYARVDTVRADKLSLLRRAGVRWLALGIESESAYVRDGVEKRLKSDDIAEVVKKIQDAGINVIANYIFGLPDDDMDSMRRTLQMAMDLRTEWANFYSAMAYPGSPLYDEAVKKGWELPARWTGYSQHSADCRPLNTRHVDGAAVLRFRDEAFYIYFSAPQYLDMINGKFGDAAIAQIEDMTTRKLERDLLTARYAPAARMSGH